MRKYKKFYLAGAMGCYGDNIKLVNEWRIQISALLSLTADMLDYDVDIINPAEFFNYIDDNNASDTELMDWELDQVKSSDVVIVNTTDILSSPGTMIEIYTAYISGIPVLAFGNEIQHPWLKRCVRRKEISDSKIVDYIKDYYLI